MLAAGGTGGHLFPAQSLAEVLKARGFSTQLMTDERVRDYGKDFPATKTHIVEAATLSLRDPLRLPIKAWQLMRGYHRAKAILRAEQPAVVVGFGGYPSFAPIQAASSLSISTVIHEQNAVLGRANAALAGKARVVAGSFPEVIGLKPELASKFVFTGNPVRSLVLKEKASPFPLWTVDGEKRLVIFGGSQGARFFSDFMPKVFEGLPEATRRSLSVVQQCRPEDIERTSQAYKEMGLRCDLQPFFMDMPKRIAAAHLIIGRSGASTIAELGVIGRPAVLVPLPGALDNDQLRNAESFANAGAGWVRPQADLQPGEFSAFIYGLLGDGLKLAAAAQCALKHGRPDAAERLADVVQTHAQSQD
jgi:UDP-N-acetylglucosamine--N-acetylmuramyl-(pentapeptide) pyrophosphoryl-undecaprenol N-acetylglucosamine transferase